MAPNSSIPYNPTDHVAPITLLPEEVFGYVDLATLADIHRYLCESELQEDVELATWMRENYLNNLGVDPGTAEIRTAQVFSKLDRAYRRVRSLTNKAQDKWPFFDRNFKQMSSAMVRNNARGEAAPGVMFPIDGMQRKSYLAMQLADESITPNASAVPGLQVPFGTKKPSRYELHSQHDQRPTRQTPVPFTPNLPVKPSEEPQLSTAVPKSETQSMSQSEVSQIEGVFDQDLSRDESSAPVSNSMSGTVAPLFNSSSSEHREVDPTVRDAGAGKVRGPNGRYLPKDDVMPEPKMTKKQGKGVKSRTNMINVKKQESSASSLVVDEPESAQAEDEDMVADVPSPSPPVPNQETTEQNGIENEIFAATEDDTILPSATDVVSRPTVASKQDLEQEELASDSGPTPAYLLAAEADPVPSNLDKLPPSSRKSNKRKSEPSTSSGDRKRGKHGGIVGRPRKSEQRGGRQSHQEPVQKQGGNAAETEQEPQMITRRTTRRSAAANLNAPVSSKTAAKPAAKPPIKTLLSRPLQTPTELPKVQPQPGNYAAANEDEVMSEVEHYATATGDETIAPTPDASKAHATPSYTLEGMPSPQLSDNHLLSIGLNCTSSPALYPRPPSRQQPYQSPYQPVASPPPPAFVAKNTMTNGTGSLHPPGHVEYFARIVTGSGGIMDLPIGEDQIESDEVKMIKRYAKYNAAPSVVPVSYTQFRQIFAFAKQD